jgi:predicted RNA-binding protein
MSKQLKRGILMEFAEILAKDKWFVIHEAGLYDKNPNLIGFRDPSEWRAIKKDQIVFYYRTSPYMKIMGIYKVIRSEEDIDRNFFITDKDGKRERFHHQHEIELVNPFECYFGTDQHQRLSFYHTLKNPKRFDNQHVFRLTRGDADFIINNNS